ncbi:MAG TPA: AMP-binding protein, partial [Polyangiales bacterium]
MFGTGEIVWRPTERWIEQANVTRLMRKLGYRIDATQPDAAAAETRAFIARSAHDIEWFWRAALLDMGFAWDVPYQGLLDTSKGNAWAQWFVGGRTNLVRNCLDRHAHGAARDKTAVIAETEDGQARRWSFAQLDVEVCKLANALHALGVREGDRVAAYMPMVAEVVIAMLATQKLGAIFIPIFSGYAPPAVRERLVEAEVKLVFTADGSMRRGKAFGLKSELDHALAGLSCVQHVIVHERLGRHSACPMQPGRDLFWNEALGSQPSACETRSMAALAPALMLFTSGTTGKPKGTVHTHAGCLATMGKELLYHFDLKPSDVFFWFSDIGWMMGPWEIIGCLMHAGTIVVFEGAPDYPEPDRVWQLVERHGVTTLGISPTAVRMLMRSGDN